MRTFHLKSPSAMARIFATLLICMCGQNCPMSNSPPDNTNCPVGTSYNESYQGCFTPDGCPAESPYLWSDGYCYATQESVDILCPTGTSFNETTQDCRDEQGCPTTHPYLWSSDGLCHEAEEPQDLPTLEVFDPGDPRLGVISKNGVTATLFGNKTADGAPEHVDAISAQDINTGVDFSAEFDSLDRPTKVIDSQGNFAEFTYTDTDVVITFHAADGTLDIQTLPLSQIPNWPAASTINIAAHQKNVGRTNVGYTRYFLIEPHVYLVGPNDVVVKELNDAFVYYNTDRTGNSPGGGLYIAPTNGQSTGYQFKYTHRDLPITITDDDCLWYATQIGRVATHAGSLLAVIALGCGLLAAPSGGTVPAACAWLAAKVGLTTALGIGVSSSVATEAALLKLCDDPQTIPADPTVATFNFTVNHPSLKGSKFGSTTLDTTGLGDGAVVLVDLKFKLEAGISALRTDPLAPAANAGYTIIFEAFPVGASIFYTVVGSDNYATEGTAVVGENLQAISKFIPGGATGVNDQFVAQLTVDGTNVLDSKIGSITFR